MTGLLSGLVAMQTSAQPVTAAESKPVPIEAYAHWPAFQRLLLSPAGDQVAMLKSDLHHSEVSFLSTGEAKADQGFHMPRDQFFSQLGWSGDRRMVMSLSRQYGILDQPLLDGRLGAINSDRSNLRTLNTRYDLEIRVVIPYTGIQGQSLIRVRPARAPDTTADILYRINTETGDVQRIEHADVPLGAKLLLDSTGEPVVADTGDHIFLRKAGGDWAPMAEIVGTTSAQALQISGDGKALYVATDDVTQGHCLVRRVLPDGKTERLSCDADSEVRALLPGFGEHADPTAVVFGVGRPDIRVLDPASHDGIAITKLLKAFPESQIEFESSSRDGKIALICVRSDRSPGDWYLFDVATQQTRFLARQWPELDPVKMGERRPFQLKARDGTSLHGYLTLPPTIPAKALPLVVMPHGGPFFVRDEWTFDSTAQLLATRGYAVLQVNFRGSSGYGHIFEEAGKRHWGTTMIDDITDATHWSIEQGYAAADRICIYGASYGGYAALMSAEREPTLYRCAIGESGVYDLPKLLKEADFSRGANSGGQAYFHDSIAADEAAAAAQSPINGAERLKADVLLIHGYADYRAPLEQAEAMRDALDRADRHYEWQRYNGEMHGLYAPGTQLDAYKKILRFLDAHIGAEAEPTK